MNQTNDVQGAGLRGLLAPFTRRIVWLLLSAFALALSYSPAGRLVPVDPAWLAVLLCGLPIVRGAALGLWQNFDLKTDVLVALALLASLAIGEIFAAGEVALIMQLGGLLEEITVARAHAGLARLVRLSPRTARVLRRGGEETILPAEAVLLGDVVRVLPGETIPVDGEVRSGNAAVAEALMTGEPLPVDKGPGDPVLSGTICAQGTLDIVAHKVGEDSALQRMIQLVESADAGKAKIVRLADRWATWIVLAALTAALAAWLVTGDMVRAVTVLVVFCPCSLVLATPTAITAAMGNASRHRFLVREGDALERLATANALALDKTGTLTLGKPGVVQVQSCEPGLADAELFALVAAAEARSEHPLGRAIVAAYRESGQPAPISAPISADMAGDFVLLPGRGVRARVAGEELLVGTEKWLAEEGIDPASFAALAAPHQAQGRSVVAVARAGRLSGLVALADAPRPEAAPIVAQLARAGLAAELLTGDQEEAASTLARSMGITRWRARCLPEDKLARMQECAGQGRRVLMVGDGVNDAPALRAAHVGIAVLSGGAGSDLAATAADIVLVGGGLSGLPHLVALSRRMMRTISYNLALSMMLNFAAIALAFLGVLNPVSGALVHNAGSILVIIHSALLLNWRGDN